MKTFNGIPVPETIRTDRIISAFSNSTDFGKVEEYAQVMRIEGLEHDFPPIKGYPSIIDESDIGKQYTTLKSVEKEHVGGLVWMVTDGHHRSFAAIEANLPYLRVEVDYNCITNEEDLKQWN